jgi:hypothetical protein
MVCRCVVFHSLNLSLSHVSCSVGFGVVADVAIYKDAPQRDSWVLVILRQYEDKKAATRAKNPTLSIDGSKLRNHLGKTMLWPADRLQLYHDDNEN